MTPQVQQMSSIAKRRPIQIMRARVFTLYFECLDEVPDGLEASAEFAAKHVLSCTVIAQDATEAIEKAQRAFPAERVSTVMEESVLCIDQAENPTPGLVIL